MSNIFNQIHESKMKVVTKEKKIMLMYEKKRIHPHLAANHLDSLH